VAWVDVCTGACALAAETRANKKKAASVEVVRKLMEIFLPRRFSENTGKDAIGNGSLTYPIRPSPRICKTASHRDICHLPVFWQAEAHITIDFSY
jgi:hypothetical protein